MNVLKVATIFALAVSVLLPYTPALAAAPGPVPPTVSVVLDTQSTIALGQPISVKLQLTNNFPDGEIWADLSNKTNGFYTISLADANGRVVQYSPPAPPSGVGGEVEIPYYAVATNDPLVRYIAVTKHLKLLHAGRYTLNVHVAVPYSASKESPTEMTRLLLPATLNFRST